MRRLFWFLWVMACICLCAPAAAAAEAENISGRELVVNHSGFSSEKMLFDGRTMESLKIRDGGHITLHHDGGIGSVYIVFGQEYGGFTVTDEDSGEVKTLGETGWLHEFLDLEAIFGHIPASVTLSFENGDAKLNELSVFSSGQVPDWVQRWAPPAEGEADLVLFSAHGDDEQLFFAGMLPYYASELGYNVQVVYLTGHRNMTVRRSHEMLDGLWAVGVRNYPVFGPFGDYNTRSLAEAYQKYSYKGITEEDLLSFAVENIRRFRPKVAVGHDLQGEYGHGMHMLYADILCRAVEISADPEQFPESAEQFGIWDVPKTYLHLYPENQIQMDWDVPLESFGGMTAYEVTKELGFPCHVSQQSYYSWYFDGIDLASEIPEYSPCEFGLYRSTVGADQEKNDFFENVTTHGEDALMEARRQAEKAEEKQPAEEAAPQTAPQKTDPKETALPAEPEEKVPANHSVFLISAGGAGILSLFALILMLKSFRKKK